MKKVKEEIKSVEVDVIIRIEEYEDGTVNCKTEPELQNSQLTLDACEIALQEYEEFAIWECEMTDGVNHIFKRI